MPKCVYCGGRGWAWYGIANNAEREPCAPCGGRGRMRIGWGIAGACLLLLSGVLVIGLILLTIQAAFGESAGSVTLKQFREYPERARTALVAGAMAVTEHAGMVCPGPLMTVKEYVTTLTHRPFDESAPWVAAYFALIDERGCGVPSGIDQKEGA